MADAADIATAHTEAVLEHTLQSRQRYQGESRTHCADCEEPIPDRRRELIPGVQLCVECQELLEQRR